MQRNELTIKSTLKSPLNRSLEENMPSVKPKMAKLAINKNPYIVADGLTEYVTERRIDDRNRKEKR
jgi:hypothetical protein